MKKYKILIIFLMFTSIVLGDWVKLGIRSDISGSLYIDSRKVKDISAGEIYSTRYQSGRYFLTLKNSEAIYQKEIDLDDTTEVFYKITKEDLFKRLVPEKPKVIVVEKIVEKIVEKPVEKVESEKAFITRENFEDSVLKRMNSGEAYNIFINMKKYFIEEDPSTTNEIILVAEDGKKLRIDAYSIRDSIQNGKYPNDYGVIALEYSLNLKDDFYRDLKEFYSSFGKNSFEDVNFEEFRQINSSDMYVIFAKNKRVEKNKMVDKIVLINHIEYREAEKYLKPLSNFEDINPKFNLLDSSDQILLSSDLKRFNRKKVNIKSIYSADGLSYNQNLSSISEELYSYRKNIALLENDGLVRERVYIVLPKEQVEAIQKIRMRSIF
ncbi:MAG: hypothetical protein ACRC4S_06505 [Cetobacterium sp.]